MQRIYSQCLCGRPIKAKRREVEGRRQLVHSCPLYSTDYRNGHTYVITDEGTRWELYGPTFPTQRREGVV